MAQRVRVKICGVRTAAVARAAAAAGADAIGLVFASESPRLVSVAESRAAVGAAGPFVTAVGLFVEQDAAAIREIAAEAGLSTVQLHGEHDAAAVEALRPLRVIRAVHFEPQRAAELLGEWDRVYRDSENLIGLLIDTPDESRAGGTGRSFDWAALRAVLDEVDVAAPIILAGGLRAENVAEAIRAVRPCAVDVSSGVESSRGVKDAEKVRAFCRAARSAG